MLAARGVELVWNNDTANEEEDGPNGGGDPRVTLWQPQGTFGTGGGQALAATNLLPALEELGYACGGVD